MKIVLYELDTAVVKSTILCRKVEGRYIIDGYDRGKIIKETIGGYGYEYSMRIDEIELDKLQVNQHNKLDNDSFMMTWMEQFISDPKCFSKIKAQFDKYEVKYDYFSWRDGS
ncbi:MAG: hypothetical protein AAGJ82_12360 [Bacteroidota bacterium]